LSRVNMNKIPVSSVLKTLLSLQPSGTLGQTLLSHSAVV
jgi:hypothetical protein